ncbi:Gfo/Idh/MocA family oxidoreductase [Alicyclobacillus tolerans]|uniref:Gfo/Idh/MocA family protein n=1 Tax=Alicyclobacillus tolerans TaxID=90970 RepID=UPI001F23153D|nr:Gfo/Idh/MocA family oxidoreductase [Alicyclobacillus tolerans]MCF8566689.1 Gfo/Idh/MocA family oxidoreductase [Alicyclobacillus tolerans]
MKVGMIGLGDIAQKAYLPVLTARSDIDLRIATRNSRVLQELGDKYRLKARFSDLDSLLQSGIEACFVHTATQSHYDIVKKLLNRGVHVYVDKPIDNHYERSAQLMKLAEDNRRLLTVGFNRRYVPAYQSMKGRKLDLIVMQKHRKDSPGEPRSVVFDDFIHIVDTLRFLLPGPITSLQVHSKLENGLLLQVGVHLSGPGHAAIGLMHRRSGRNEEVLECMGDGESFKMVNLNDITHYAGMESRTHPNEWTPVPAQRGFEQICDDFLSRVRAGEQTSSSAGPDLLTHEWCEAIVRQIEEQA